MLQCKEKLLSGLKNFLLDKESAFYSTDLNMEEQLYNV